MGVAVAKFDCVVAEDVSLGVAVVSGSKIVGVDVAVAVVNDGAFCVADGSMTEFMWMGKKNRFSVLSCAIVVSAMRSASMSENSKTK